jgi:pilus assembly protein CpaE
MSRFVIVSSDAAFEQLVRAVIAVGHRGTLEVLPTEAAVADAPELVAALTDRAEVLVLGPDLTLEDALRLATVVDVRYPELSVVLIGASDSDLVVQAMRVGIRHILSPDADAATIRLELERACQTFASRQRTRNPVAAASQRDGRVIGVFSPKGGVGKTTIATNIAVGLGKIAPMSVVIVDLDLQFGDVASGLYLEPNHTVTDAVSAPASADTLVLKAFLTVHPAGIYAMCAPKSPAEADQITPSQVTHLLGQLAQQFDYVVIDTAPGLPELGLAAMEQCTDIVWVSAMDVPSARGLRSGIDTLKQLDILPSKRHVVLNMTDSRTGLTVQDMESTIGAPIDVAIPRLRSVAFATNRGVPLLQEPGRDRAARGMKQLVDRFTPEWTSKSGKQHRRAVI